MFYRYSIPTRPHAHLRGAGNWRAWGPSPAPARRSSRWGTRSCTCVVAHGTWHMVHAVASVRSSTYGAGVSGEHAGNRTNSSHANMAPGRLVRRGVRVGGINCGRRGRRVPLQAQTRPQPLPHLCTCSFTARECAMRLWAIMQTGRCADNTPSSRPPAHYYPPVHDAVLRRDGHRGQGSLLLRHRRGQRAPAAAFQG